MPVKSLKNILELEVLLRGKNILDILTK